MQVDLDAIDRRILLELQRDGRLTNQELSDRVGLSPSPCLRRMRRLEEAGAIDRYVALVDAASVGLQITAFARVALASQDASQLDQFEREVSRWPEVLECYLMTGEVDYQLRVVAKSLSDYESFLREKLARIPGVAKIHSSLAFRPIVYRTELPV
ncbi:MAG: winged helix-turn-helix transcriptional regulator [Phenylobacterium sp.]|uniref:Lrp/AsnC family transcriptional regulator n=1 Tax=Phenylobacterium sp. TaxID=1871053 RepID=UPI0025CC9AED|nr:Lrp/AsnC family transcriptional regulator [Phenylobacterium sp.]MBI1200249.1 winged helix-turn-helix transcriptional regulator [Phenylobacterium sp.]